MTVRGYCRTCDTLVKLVPGPCKSGGRQQWWFPVSHLGPDGKPCEGSDRGI